MLNVTASMPESVFVPLDSPIRTELGTNVLGVVDFGTVSSGPGLADGHPRMSVHMVDDAAEGVAEVWRTSMPVTSGNHRGIGFSHDGEHMFCAGRVPASRTYTDDTREAYTAAFEVLLSHGYSNVFRMWNFIDRINQDNAENLEIYRDFCRGRAEAFERGGIPNDQMPAATGIGSRSGGIAFYLMASRSGTRLNIENPRQVSAYEYPRQYGPRSPSFARATYLAPAGNGAVRGQLYVSGTASVLGHVTAHEGDIAKQLEVTFENLELLVGAENLARHGVEARYDLKDLRNIKVYVRHRAHMDAVRERCSESFSPDAGIVFLNVDICRSELLVEIEGIAM